MLRKSFFGVYYKANFIVIPAKPRFPLSTVIPENSLFLPRKKCEFIRNPIWSLSSHMNKNFRVYIVTDKPFGTLYVGITSDLPRRMYEHRNGINEGFTKKYGLKMLVWSQEFNTAIEAIEFEKKIKKWKRNRKIDLIQKDNLKWTDLYESING